MILLTKSVLLSLLNVLDHFTFYMVSKRQRVVFFFAAYKSAIREQKLTMVLSAAKREKDFYLAKVEKSRAMTEIDARMEKVLTLPFSENL